jgi:tetratricopeptide (TPR) repeat protein
VAAGRRTLALEGGAESSYAVLARALMHAGQLDAASAVCAAAGAKGVAGDQIQGLILEIASARGEHAAIDRAVAAARGKPAERDVLLFAAHDAYRRGQVRRGEALYTQAADLAKDQDLADTTLASRARDLADLGLADQARTLLARVPADAGPGDFLFTLADVGDAVRAGALLERDLKAAPTDTLLVAVFAPETRAALDLRRGRPAEAVAALRPALPYEGRDNDVPYLRGRAYLAAGDGPRAAAEFRKILDHPGVEPASPLHPLAALGLARAERLAGTIPAARRAYQAFLADWKDADPDLPPLLAARAEYAALPR